MMKQGAREFVFIGRSGLDKKQARQLVKDLEDSGARVQVVRGDVGNYEDVQKCVGLVDGLIGGVVHAAMGLDVRVAQIFKDFDSFLTFPAGVNFHYDVKRVLACKCKTQGPGFLESS